MNDVRILLLPGWLDSDPGHWQSRWEALYGDERVQQADWLWPKRGDWMARLDEVLLQSDRKAVLVAHSLGCQLVASWAAHSKHSERVKGALLVAPPDTEREDMPPNLSSWRSITRQRLPFAAIVVTSTDDPYCRADRSAQMAAWWGASQQVVGSKGHINTETGLGDWPDGRAWVQAMARG